MAQSNNYKAPPGLTDDGIMKIGKRKSKFGESLLLWKKKQGPAIFLTLTGQGHEAILELAPDTLLVDSGVENLLKASDHLYLKDRGYSAYEAYETFEKFERPPSVIINSYIVEFERLYHKIKNYDMDLPDVMLAYKFLKNANISEHHKQLVRVTLGKLKYNAVKEQLKKVFSDSSNFAGSIKEEQNMS